MSLILNGYETHVISKGSVFEDPGCTVDTAQSYTVTSDLDTHTQGVYVLRYTLDQNTAVQKTRAVVVTDGLPDQFVPYMAPLTNPNWRHVEAVGGYTVSVEKLDTTTTSHISLHGLLSDITEPIAYDNSTAKLLDLINDLQDVSVNRGTDADSLAAPWSINRYSKLEVRVEHLKSDQSTVIIKDWGDLVDEYDKGQRVSISAIGPKRVNDEPTGDIEGFPAFPIPGVYYIHYRMKFEATRFQEDGGDENGVVENVIRRVTVAPTVNIDALVASYTISENTTKVIDDCMAFWNTGDTNDHTNVYTLTVSDTSNFEIHNNELHFKVAPDYETNPQQYIVEVGGTVNGVPLPGISTTINVINVNEPPSFAESSARVLNFIIGKSHTISFIAATDPDGDTLNYSIYSGNDQNAFTLEEQNGVRNIKYTGETGFAANQVNGDHVLVIRASDEDEVSLYDELTLTLECTRLSMTLQTTIPLNDTLYVHPTTDNTPYDVNVSWNSELAMSSIDATFELQDSQGEAVASTEVTHTSVSSGASLTFAIPAGTSTGSYKLVCTSVTPDNIFAVPLPSTETIIVEESTLTFEAVGPYDLSLPIAASVELATLTTTANWDTSVTPVYSIVGVVDSNNEVISNISFLSIVNNKLLFGETTIYVPGKPSSITITVKAEYTSVYTTLDIVVNITHKPLELVLHSPYTLAPTVDVSGFVNAEAESGSSMPIWGESWYIKYNHSILSAAFEKVKVGEGVTVMWRGKMNRDDNTNGTAYLLNYSHNGTSQFSVRVYNGWPFVFITRTSDSYSGWTVDYGSGVGQLTGDTEYIYAFTSDLSKSDNAYLYVFSEDANTLTLNKTYKLQYTFSGTEPSTLNLTNNRGKSLVELLDLNDDSGSLFIGARDEVAGFHKGTVRNLRIYSTYLVANEISTLIQSLQERTLTISSTVESVSVSDTTNGLLEMSLNIEPALAADLTVTTRIAYEGSAHATTQEDIIINATSTSTMLYVNVPAQSVPSILNIEITGVDPINMITFIPVRSIPIAVNSSHIITDTFTVGKASIIDVNVPGSSTLQYDIHSGNDDHVFGLDTQNRLNYNGSGFTKNNADNHQVVIRASDGSSNADLTMTLVCVHPTLSLTYNSTSIIESPTDNSPYDVNVSWNSELAMSSIDATFELQDSQGEAVASTEVTHTSVSLGASLTFAIPAGTSTGSYKLVCTSVTPNNIFAVPFPSIEGITVEERILTFEAVGPYDLSLPIAASVELATLTTTANWDTSVTPVYSIVGVVDSNNEVISNISFLSIVNNKLLFADTPTSGNVPGDPSSITITIEATSTNGPTTTTDVVVNISYSSPTWDNVGAKDLLYGHSVQDPVQYNTYSGSRDVQYRDNEFDIWVELNATTTNLPSEVGVHLRYYRSRFESEWHYITVETTVRPSVTAQQHDIEYSTNSSDLHVYNLNSLMINPSISPTDSHVCEIVDGDDKELFEIDPNTNTLRWGNGMHSANYPVDQVFYVVIQTSINDVAANTLTSLHVTLRNSYELLLRAPLTIDSTIESSISAVSGSDGTGNLPVWDESWYLQYSSSVSDAIFAQIKVGEGVTVMWRGKLSLRDTSTTCLLNYTNNGVSQLRVSFYDGWPFVHVTRNSGSYSGWKANYSSGVGQLPVNVDKIYVLTSELSDSGSTTLYVFSEDDEHGLEKKYDMIYYSKGTEPSTLYQDIGTPLLDNGGVLFMGALSTTSGFHKGTVRDLRVYSAYLVAEEINAWVQSLQNQTLTLSSHTQSVGVSAMKGTSIDMILTVNPVLDEDLVVTVADQDIIVNANTANTTFGMTVDSRTESTIIDMAITGIAPANTVTHVPIRSIPISVNVTTGIVINDFKMGQMTNSVGQEDLVLQSNSTILSGNDDGRFDIVNNQLAYDGLGFSPNSADNQHALVIRNTNAGTGIYTDLSITIFCSRPVLSLALLTVGDVTMGSTFNIGLTTSFPLISASPAFVATVELLDPSGAVSSSQLLAFEQGDTSISHAFTLPTEVTTTDKTYSVRCSNVNSAIFEPHRLPSLEVTIVPHSLIFPPPKEGTLSLSVATAGDVLSTMGATSNASNGNNIIYSIVEVRDGNEVVLTNYDFLVVNGTDIQYNGTPTTQIENDPDELRVTVEVELRSDDNTVLASTTSVLVLNVVYPTPTFENMYVGDALIAGNGIIDPIQFRTYRGYDNDTIQYKDVAIGASPELAQWEQFDQGTTLLCQTEGITRRYYKGPFRNVEYTTMLTIKVLSTSPVEFVDVSPTKLEATWSSTDNVVNLTWNRVIALPSGDRIDATEINLAHLPDRLIHNVDCYVVGGDHVRESVYQGRTWQASNMDVGSTLYIRIDHMNEHIPNQSPLFRVVISEGTCEVTSIVNMSGHPFCLALYVNGASSTLTYNGCAINVLNNGLITSTDLVYAIGKESTSYGNLQDAVVVEGEQMYIQRYVVTLTNDPLSPSWYFDQCILAVAVPSSTTPVDFNGTMIKHSDYASKYITSSTVIYPLFEADTGIRVESAKSSGVRYEYRRYLSYPVYSHICIPQKRVLL